MVNSADEQQSAMQHGSCHAIGDTVAGRFVIERVAGSGGMAIIYRAYDSKSGGVVALKELLLAETDLVARFKQEAELLRQVQHPNIVRYVDEGVDEGGHMYLAMEWLEGEDLARRLMRGRCSVAEALKLMLCVTRGVAALHAVNVVHRDLKPENIFLVEGRLDEPRVIDLGIALPLSNARFLTGPGLNVGTPAYMAPEQIRAERAVSPAADVYSLGCVLFACIAGRLPFVAEHAVATMVKALFEVPPRLQSLVAGVPIEVDELCARLLSKKVEERPASAGHLLYEIESVTPQRWILNAFVETIAPVLTQQERELISVVVASPLNGKASKMGGRGHIHGGAGGLEQPTSFVDPQDALQVEMIHSLAELYGANVEVLRDGSLAAVITANRSPSDMATVAARCGLALRDIGEGVRVAVVTGWDVMAGRQPLGRVIDCAVSMLKAAEKAPKWKESENESAILLDAMTAALLGDRFVITHGGAHTVLIDERSADLDAWNAIDQRTPFVGRAREKARLIDLFQAVKEQSKARVALITAEAGTGKSRLCREVLAHIKERWWPLAIWQADADAISAGSPLGHLRRMCRSMANLRDGEPFGIQRQKLGAWVARNVSPKDRQRVTEFIGEAVGVRFRENPSPEMAAAMLDSVLMGDQVRRAWVDLISAECRVNPVVIVLEELQWGDAATIECIDMAMRILPDLPLFVVCIARPDVYRLFPELFARRPMTVLRLAPLDAASCRTIARARLGHVATDALVERITEQAAGNTFCMMELIRSALDGNLSDIPLSVLATTQRRISALDADARRILRAASIFGHVFWQGAIRLLVNVDSGRVDQMLGALERDAIVTRRGTTLFHDEVEYAFHDSLVREAAYVMLTEEDQRLGHRLAGEWLLRAGETDAVVLATHYDRGGASDSACRLYEMAAEQSLAAGDLAAVADLCARSIACGAAGPVLGAVRRLQAEIDVWRGDFTAGAAHGVEAMALLPRGSPSWYVAASALAWAALAIGDHDRLLVVAGALISRIDVDSPVTSQLVVFARVAAGLYRGGYGAHAERLIDVLMHASPTQQQIPIVAANIEEAAAWRAMYGGDRVQSYQRFHASAMGFARAGDIRNQIRVGSNASALRMMLGEYEEAAADLRILRNLSTRLQLENVSANIEQNLGLALTYQGALEEARELEERAIASFSAQGDRGLESAARIYLAVILMRLGRLDEAEKQAIDALALAANTPAFICLALAVLADVKRAMGRVSEASPFAEQAMTLLNELGNIEEGEAIVRLVFIECLFELGDYERARGALRQACQRLRADAVRIVDPLRRQRFLREAPEHRRTVELAAVHLGSAYSSNDFFAGNGLQSV